VRERACGYSLYAMSERMTTVQRIREVRRLYHEHFADAR
jgi:hypothetical protein